MNEHDIDSHSELCSQISMIYEIHSLGGPLHVVLDDGNTDDDSIRFCLDTCRDHHAVLKDRKQQRSWSGSGICWTCPVENGRELERLPV